MLLTSQPAPFGDRLRTAIALRPDLNRSTLAQECGLHRATIHRLLIDEIRPNRDTIWALAIALRVDPGWLAGFYDGEPRILEAS